MGDKQPSIVTMADYIEIQERFKEIVGRSLLETSQVVVRNEQSFLDIALIGQIRDKGPDDIERNCLIYTVPFGDCDHDLTLIYQELEKTISVIEEAQHLFRIVKEQKDDEPLWTITPSKMPASFGSGPCFVYQSNLLADPLYFPIKSWHKNSKIQGFIYLCGEIIKSTQHKDPDWYKSRDIIKEATRLYKANQGSKKAIIPFNQRITKKGYIYLGLLIKIAGNDVRYTFQTENSIEDVPSNVRLAKNIIVYLTKLQEIEERLETVSRTILEEDLKIKINVVRKGPEYVFSINEELSQYFINRWCLDISKYHERSKDPLCAFNRVVTILEAEVSRDQSTTIMQEITINLSLKLRGKPFKDEELPKLKNYMSHRLEEYNRLYR